MGTRCLIEVKDFSESIFIYKQYDSTHKRIKRAYKTALKRTYNGLDQSRYFDASEMAAALVSVLKKKYPGDVYITTYRDHSVNYKFLITKDGCTEV